MALQHLSIVSPSKWQGKQRTSDLGTSSSIDAETAASTMYLASTEVIHGG